jgi:hypothetical protein
MLQYEARNGKERKYKRMRRKKMTKVKNTEGWGDGRQKG